jgi:hypothetical protein
MNWRETLLPHVTEMWSEVVTFLPNLLSAILVLVAGWLLALLAGAITRWALGRTKLDNRLAAWATGDDKPGGVEIERWFSRGVYYLVMLFVLVAFFEVLGLTLVTEPLNRLLIQVVGFLPRLLGASLLVLAAWVVATIVRSLTSRLFSMTRMDDRLAEQSGIRADQLRPISSNLAELLYWLVFILFLPAILGALALEGLLEPVQGMIAEMFSFLPNLFAALLILAVGWFVARIVQRLVSNLLAVTGLNKLGKRAGLSAEAGARQFSDLAGLVVYILILLPVVISALAALELEAITRPASDMLAKILGALPGMFAAVVVLTLAYIVGRLLSNLLASLLEAAGFNSILIHIGLAREETKGDYTPARIVGKLTLVALMIIAAAEASRLIGFATLGDLVAGFLVFVGHILLGLIVFGIGLYLASLAHRTILVGRTPQAALLAAVARVSIIVLGAALGLRAMGFANEIVNIAFGLLLGAIAVAAALAFGLGSRDIAAEAVKGWTQSIRKPDKS